MDLRFSWDPRKAAANARKHGVRFEEAATAFGDPLSITIADPEHSQDDERWILLGVSASERLLVVVHVEPADDHLRSSARGAQRNTYEKA